MRHPKSIFDGFMSVYTQEDDEEAEGNTLIRAIWMTASKLDTGRTLKRSSILHSRLHIIQKHRLVKALEEQGIGRPSTYAPTITTILARRYIVKENKNLYVTELGEVVNSIMKKRFPSIVDVQLYGEYGVTA